MLSDLLPLLWLLSLLPAAASAIALLAGRQHFALHAWLAVPAAFLAALLAVQAPPGERAGGLLAVLVLVLGAIVQRFSVRFLQGDRDQGRAHALLTFATVAAALAWQATAAAPLLAAWATALWSLTRLIGLARDWPAARQAERLAQRTLGAGALALAILVAVLAATGSGGELPAQLAPGTPPLLADALAALLLVAVLAPAAQWPLQRWLMNSLVAPTPVSAVMHAGFVNAGGVLLVKFGGLLAATAWAIPLLLLLATASVLAGAGMARVQVDVKRQLAASTVAQMGLMLAQCALGAYAAALVHLVMHGLFKANLFLLSGSTVTPAPQRAEALPLGPVVLAGAATAAGILLLDARAPQAADVLSSVLLGMAVAHGVLGMRRRLVHARAWPWLAGALLGFLFLQAGLRGWLAPGLPPASAPGLPWLVICAAGLAGGVALLDWLPRHPHHPLARRAWWWLVAAAEPTPATQDPHPLHLSRRLGQGA